jgi:hypothetical protein
VLLHRRHIAIHLLEQAFGVVAFREANRRRDFPHQLILLHQPGAVEIPPLGTVEDVVKTGLSGLFGLIGGASQSLGQKRGVRVFLANFAD